MLVKPLSSQVYIKDINTIWEKHKRTGTRHKFVSLFIYQITSVSWFVCLHVLILASKWLTAQETSAAALIVAVGSDYERCGLDIGFGSIDCLD